MNRQLKQSASVQKQFTQRFIVYTHNASQKIINAYLAGDSTELEKRQYYASLNEYGDFLKMIDLAKNLVPAQNHLATVLNINYYYLKGLISRLNIARSTKTDSLLKEAFSAQFQTLKLEPYAAYAHNEIGNLYTYKEMLDSAKYHYDLATVLAPTWVIPWSNKIRLNVMWNKFDEAKIALAIADSLQPGLDLVQINGGFLMENINNLAVKGYYLNAIKPKALLTL